MSLKLYQNLRMPVALSEQEVLTSARRRLGLPAHVPAYIYKKSTDARNGVSFVYTVAFETDIAHPDLKEAATYTFTPSRSHKGEEVHIVGFGPAGMFCALLLAQHGMKPIVWERGQAIDQRTKDVDAFWKTGTVNPESNVQFGEGGAGSFSDGKLTTGINDPRCRRVLETLAQFGAPRDILYRAKPHIGTDYLKKAVKAIREEVIRLGGDVRFSSKAEDIQVENNRVVSVTVNGQKIPVSRLVLATGNGARDTYAMLLSKQLPITPKPFSAGFRMEHRQEEINRAMYGKDAKNPHLPPAEYLFSHVTNKAQQEAVYSFCMCPGGQVVNASSEPGYLVTNGMSHYARNGENANAALLASVSFDTPQAGIAYQKSLEKAAYQVAKGAAPVTTAKAFLAEQAPDKFGNVTPSFLPSTAPYDLNRLFPPVIAARLREGLRRFEQRICKNPMAVLTGVETRTSAPLRLLRNESMETVGVKGLYPCGEGMGYAGGIMSAAVDGLKVAEAILNA